MEISAKNIKYYLIEYFKDYTYHLISTLEPPPSYESVSTYSNPQQSQNEENSTKPSFFGTTKIGNL